MDYRSWRLLLGLLIVTIAIPLLAVGFVGFRFEERLADWLQSTLTPVQFGSAVVAILALDVFLPVPSSLFSTLASARLGIVAGTCVSWLGMSLGAVIAFVIARIAGGSWVARWCPTEDWLRLEQLAERRGGAMLVVTRALPILAEAAVLLAGTLNLSWRRFLPPVLLANLGLSLAYGLLGHWAFAGNAVGIALAASIVVPLLGTWLARRLWPVERPR